MNKHYTHFFIFLLLLLFSACNSRNKAAVKTSEKKTVKLVKVKSETQNNKKEKNITYKNDELAKIDVSKYVNNFNKLMDISASINAGSADYLRVNEIMFMTNQNFGSIRKLALMAEKSKNILGANKIHEMALQKAMNVGESNQAISGMTINSFKLKNYNAAINLAKNTEIISKKKSNAGAAFSTITLMVGADAAIKQGDYKQARIMLKKVIETPCSVSAKEVALLKYAKTYEYEGKIEKARVEYKKILPELKGNKNLYNLVKNELAQMETTEEQFPVIKDDQRKIAVNMMREKMGNITGTPTEQIIRSNTYLTLIKQIEEKQ